MTAITTSLAYYEAWTSGDLDTAWKLLADDVDCLAPPKPLKGRAAVAAFMGPFAQSLTRSALLAAYGDDETSLIMYDTANAAVASAPAAELHTVRAGVITHMRIIFDRLPFALARGDVVQRG